MSIVVVFIIVAAIVIIVGVCFPSLVRVVLK